MDKKWNMNGKLGIYSGLRFPKTRDTSFLRVPLVRIIIFWDLYWGLPVLKFPLDACKNRGPLLEEDAS